MELSGHQTKRYVWQTPESKYTGQDVKKSLVPTGGEHFHGICLVVEGGKRSTCACVGVTFRTVGHRIHHQ